MDLSEKLVADFLKYRGYTDVVYEPDGRVPSDFLVNGRIAIEVQRLNQNFEADRQKSGLEEVRIPLFQRIKKLSYSIGSPCHDRSWFLNFSFHRPVESWRTLAPKLTCALKKHLNAPSPERICLSLGNGFELEILPASKRHVTAFVMGAHIDEDSGGWVISEIKRNLDLCVKEKTFKRKNARNLYQEWWLVLSDHIGYGIDNDDLTQLRQLIIVPPEWQKIILVHPLNHKHAVEI